MSEGKKFFGADWQAINDALNVAIVAVQAIPRPVSHTPTYTPQPPYSGHYNSGPTPIPRGVLEIWDAENEEAFGVIGGTTVPGFTMPMVGGGTWTNEIPPNWVPNKEFDDSVNLLMETSLLWWADDFRTWWYAQEVPLFIDHSATREAVTKAQTAMAEAVAALAEIQAFADHGKNWKV